MCDALERSLALSHNAYGAGLCLFARTAGVYGVAAERRFYEFEAGWDLYGRYGLVVVFVFKFGINFCLDASHEGFEERRRGQIADPHPQQQLAYEVPLIIGAVEEHLFGTMELSLPSNISRVKLEAEEHAGCLRGAERRAPTVRRHWGNCSNGHSNK